MAFTRTTVATNNISSLADKPNQDNGLTSAQLKALWDKYGEDNNDFLNDVLIDELESTTDGSSGAKNIGLPPISNLGNVTNVEDALKAASQLPNLSEVINARGGYPALDERLDNLDTQLAEKANLTKWKNKIGLALGDSVTWQDGQPYAVSGLIAKGYLTLIKEQKGLSEYRNYGQSGKSMSGSTSGDTTVIGKTLNYTDVDFVTIFAGTNDFKLNKVIGSLGKIGDTNFNTEHFIGAYKSLIEYILTQKPTIQIFLFTPLQRDSAGYDVNYTNLANHKLIDYVNAVKRIGALYSIPVLDLYSVSGITKKTFTTYTLDSLHPNDVGYARMTESISPFLETRGYNTDSGYLYAKPVIKGIVVYDGFNRADTVDIIGTPDISPDNAPWEIVTGSDNAHWQILNNKAITTFNGTGYITIDSGISDNCEISVKYPAIAQDRRLCFRVTDYTNMFIVTITSGNAYRLIRILTGNATTLATGTATATNGDTIKVKLNGSTIQVYVNGTLDITSTDTNFLTSTKHGIGSATTSSGSFDEFQILAI